VERRHSLERRPKSLGPGIRPQVQVSEIWQHRLPSGGNVQVCLVADQQMLNQAAYRLNMLRPETVTAMDFQGINLANGGRLCLGQIVYHDGVNLNCFLFDMIQLGDSFQVLMPFLQNGQVSKLIFDVQHAKTLAQQFGITLAGIFLAPCAFEMLASRPASTMIDLLEWCGVAPPFARSEALMMERAPELWSHRPLAKDTLVVGVQSICYLHAAGHVLWMRLRSTCGPNAGHMVLNNSHTRVQTVAAVGWQLRQAGQDAPDPELNDWLARRFGKPDTSTTEPEVADNYELNTAVREGDSPRTASWRATVAKVQGSSSRAVSRSAGEPSRQRSSSPTLESWIARRNAVFKSGDQPKVHRATSLPPRPSEFIKDNESFKPTSPTMEPFRMASLNLDQLAGDGRTWAEMLDDERAGEDALFKDLQKEEQRRLAQAEGEANIAQ